MWKLVNSNGQVHGINMQLNVSLQGMRVAGRGNTCLAELLHHVSHVYVNAFPKAHLRLSLDISSGNGSHIIVHLWVCKESSRRVGLWEPMAIETLQCLKMRATD